MLELVIEGKVINRDNVADYLEGKCKSVGNVIHKGILRDAAAAVRQGK